MKEKKRRILWVDNTGAELKLYVRFLEYQGFNVSFTTNSEKGISLLRDWMYDAVLLNSGGPAPNGQHLLAHIRQENPHIPIILLISDSESELQINLHEADDVFMMPKSPQQFAAELTFLIEKDAMREVHTPQAYVNSFNTQRALGQHPPNDWQAWIDTYVHLVEWELKLDTLQNVDELKAIHAIEKRETNAAFTAAVEDSYCHWLASEDSPTFSVDVFYKYVIPEVQRGKQVLFVTVDCMRLDHWLKIEPLLYPMFHITKNYYYSILPTVTRYARNAIFSGLFPRELAQRHPNLYIPKDECQSSGNRHEKELMRLQLERHGILLKPAPHYFKIFDTRGEMKYLHWLTNVNQISLAALVIGFLDMLTHTRCEVPLLQQLIPNEEAFRTLIQAWFQHSALYKMLKIAAERGITVVLTSDHGSVVCQNAVKVSSRSKLSAGLRFKEGKNIVCAREAGLEIKAPETYRLPGNAAENHYIFAKENCYFVYEPQFHVYKELFQDSYQHGGISLEEMILPCVVLEPK